MMTRVFGRMALLACLLAAGPAWAESVQVDVEGAGATREEAVAKALSSAVEQVTGVVIEAQQMSATVAASLSTKESDTATLTQVNQAAIARASKGIIRSYRVLAVQPEDGTHFLAHLSVEVEKFKPRGLGNESRRRIAVAAFTGSSGVDALLRDRLSAYLAQTRRFAVLDRANDSAYQHEMALLQSGDVPLTERVRLGQTLGADYIVTGTVRRAGAHQSDTVIALTGERVQRASYAAEVDYQVIEIATRQVKWADSVRIAEGGEGRVSSGVLDTIIGRIAARIGDQIASDIYPLRLIKFDDPANLVINEGGMALHPGERLRAYVMGEVLVDPYTKEPLGRDEHEVGIVEVRRVEPKLSYARLVTGHLPKAGQDVVLRRTSTAGAPAAHPHRRRPAGPVVVKLPFDK